MKVYLNSVDQFSDIIEIDFNDDNLIFLKNSFKNTSGRYQEINSHIIGFFSFDDYAFLLIDKKKIKCCEIIEIKFKRLCNKSCFLVKTNNETFSFSYENKIPVISDSFYEEDEDVDICLWIYNLITNKNRLDIFIKHNSI